MTTLAAALCLLALLLALLAGGVWIAIALAVVAWAGLAFLTNTPPDILLQTMSGHDSTFVARAALPFFAMMLMAIALITVFPGIVTWLPDALMLKRP